MRLRLLVPLLSLLMLDSSLRAQSNILSNGGFETGLMCYSHWIWGKAEYAGDYKFRLSTDAHSGKYSLEIACEGADCARAAIYSERIPVEPTKMYMLSAYAKCPAGRTAFLHVPDEVAAEGNVTTNIKCDDKWNLATLVFTAGAKVNTAFFYVFNNDKSWLRVDDVVLTFVDGTAPRHQVLHPGQRDVKIAGKTVIVDGKPFLSLGFFDVGYQDLAEAAALGGNTINGFPQLNASDCFYTGQKSYVDQLYELGMSFLPDSSSSARLGTADVFANIAQTYANHLANIVWFMSDETDHPAVKWFHVEPATLVAEHAALKSKTTLPDASDFQMAAYGAVSDIAPYSAASDIWMAEPYGDDFSRVNHAIDLFNSVQPKPIWLAQDAINAPLIVPKAYWAIIAGATGIHYFTWTDFKKDPAKLNAAAQVFSELKELKNAIFGDPLDTLVTAPAGIAAMSRFDPAAGVAYILAANGEAKTIPGNFAVKGLEAGQKINVLFENRTIIAKAGSFSDEFAGVSRHVYAVQCAAGASQTAGSAAAFPVCR